MKPPQAQAGGLSTTPPAGAAGKRAGVDAPRAGAAAQSEIAALLQTLQAVDARLQELRAMELDADAPVELVSGAQARDNLRESDRRLGDLLENVPLASVMVDREARITYCNGYLLQMTGWRRAEVVGRDWFETFMPSAPDDRKPAFAALLADSPESWHRENEISTRAGERRLVRWNNAVIRSGGGEIIGVASIGEDITHSRAAEDASRRMGRLHAMASGINGLVLRVRSRDQLFRETCRIAAAEGGFQVAWIGAVDPLRQTLVVVASAGTDPRTVSTCLDDSRDQLLLGDDAQPTLGPPAQAANTGEAVIVRDSRPAARVGTRRSRARPGTSALVSLPLLNDGQPAAVLTLHAAQPGHFDAAEMRLLHGVAADIAFAIAHIEKQERLDYLAYYDALTGLANRRLFLERLEQRMLAASIAGQRVAVCVVDLERFKSINDSLGQAAGDALLRQVAEWLTRNNGDATALARIGPDLFAVVLPTMQRYGTAARLVDRAMERFLWHPFQLGDAVFRIAAKVGGAVYPDAGDDADALLRHAESALKRAKADGARCMFYVQEMTERSAGQLNLENQLRRALENGEFVLHYQPKRDLASGALTGAEALIRWHDPGTGLVPPARFIPVLEQTGLIDEVGRWAVHKAIEDYLGWCDAGLQPPRIAVNVSPLQLRKRGFINEISKALAVDPRAMAGLELEITESVIMEDIKNSISTLQAIRCLGVTIAIDDFGTGFSSLSYLSQLPVDTLKIDRSFVHGMLATHSGQALVSTIILLAHSLDLKVVAEGVETDAQATMLRSLGCNEMQGFLFGPSVPRAQFEASHLSPPMA